MAFLDATTLSDLQTRNATNEKFAANYGMLDLAVDSGKFVDFISPDTMAAMQTMSGARSAQIPVIKDQVVTVNTTPGFSNIPINLGETANYAFTAFDIFSGFRLYNAAAENNQIQQEFYADAIMNNVLKAMAVQADTIVGTQMEARKTQLLNHTAQISQNDGVYTFNGGTDVLEIDKAAQKDTMFYQLTQLMQANQLPGRYKIVTSPAGLVVGNAEALKYRAGNEKQLDFAQGGVAFGDRYISDQLTTAVNFDGFLVRDGDIGIIENFPFDFRQGTTLGAKKWSVSKTRLPFLNMRANIFVNSEATEANSLVTPGTDTNLTMTTWEEMAIWSRFYVVHKYNSDLTTRQNGIVKLQGQTT